MEHARACAVGVDVGGTKLAGGIVELASGRVLARSSLPTLPERGGEAVLADALRMAAALCGEARARGLLLRGVGAGVCELVDPRGWITSEATLAWRGPGLLTGLARMAPAHVESDVRAHALAEARYGAGRGLDLFAFVSVGTGISSCLVQGGRPLAGARGNALVLASTPQTATCERCGAVSRPVLEEYAGGPGLVARLRRAGGSAERAEDVLALAAAGDTAAAEVVGSAGAALGVSLAWLANVLDPQAIVVGGGLGTAGGLYWERMEAAAREHIYADDTRGLPIVMAQLGADAGLIGAAAAFA